MYWWFHCILSYFWELQAKSQGEWGVSYPELFSESNLLTVNRYTADAHNFESDELFSEDDVLGLEFSERTLDHDVDDFNLNEELPFTTLNISEFDNVSIQQEPQCCQSQMRKSTPEVRKHP